MTRTGAYADADIRTRLHALDHEHAMRHGAALAEGINAQGGPHVRVWGIPAKGVRVYFPGEAGYLSVGPDGSVSEVSGRYRTFAESALYPAWKRAVRAGREVYRAGLLARLTAHDAERVAIVAEADAVRECAKA